MFGESSNEFCSALANVTKKICTEKCTPISTEAILACQVTPLNKNPCSKPIAVGEILKRIIEKVVVTAIKEDVFYQSNLCQYEQAINLDVRQLLSPGIQY